MQEIVYEVYKFRYKDIDKLFDHLGISDTDWNFDEAKKEFDYIINSEISNYSPSGKPVLTIISGIPYSGKSTFIKDNTVEPELSIIISFDTIMKKLSYYNKLISIDKKIAFSKCELPARIIGYELLQKSIEKKINIIFEHSSTPPEHLELYSEISDRHAYHVKLIYLKCSVETAKKRAEKNNFKRDQGRYTPLEYIDSRYDAIKKMLIKYKDNFDVLEVDQK